MKLSMAELLLIAVVFSLIVLLALVAVLLILAQPPEQVTAELMGAISRAAV